MLASFLRTQVQRLLLGGIDLRAIFDRHLQAATAHTPAAHVSDEEDEDGAQGAAQAAFVGQLRAIAAHLGVVPRVERLSPSCLSVPCGCLNFLSIPCSNDKADDEVRVAQLADAL